MGIVARSESGQFVLKSGRHHGKTLEQVAQEDPGYLTWIWTTPKVYSAMGDAEAYALEDVMKKFNISPLSS